MDQLDFEYHWKRYETRMGPCPSSETAIYFTHQAEYLHSLAVHSALTEARLAIQTVEPMLSLARAKDFLKYGVGRRLEMIWTSYREIILDLVAPNRIEPLPQDGVSAVERDLNVIYINITGVLDNYAWCLLHEVTPHKVNTLRPREIGLFSSAVTNDSNFSELNALLSEKKEWHKELKTRRDPVTHRFPLYMPPCSLNPEQQIRYQELEDKILNARNNLNFDTCDELRRQQEKIGTFVAFFIHDFNEPPIPIYPTVPQDIANLIRISERVHNFLNVRRRIP